MIVPATSLTTDRQRRSLVVLAGDGRTSDMGARALARSLAEAGVEVRYMGREPSARQIAAAVTEERADAVEFCVVGGGGVVLLRELLRELRKTERRRVSIVVHRVQ